MVSITFLNLFFDFIDFHHAIFHRCLILPMIHRNLWITATAECRLWQIMPKPHFGKIFFLSLLLCGKNCVWDIWLARLMTTEHILNYNCANFYGSKLPRWWSNFITFGWTYCTFKVDCLKLPSFYDLICKLYWKLVKIQNDFLDDWF